MVGTTLVPDLPPEVWERLGRLPFRPASPELSAERTLKAALMAARGQGETVPIDEDTLAKARRALPFAGATAGTGAVPFPPLRLTQYASLCAELAASPERAADILRRYHVPSEASRRALDEHWQARLLGRWEEQVEFERALREYSAWLRGRRA
jgi:hypothetical protein